MNNIDMIYSIAKKRFVPSCDNSPIRVDRDFFR